MTFNLKPVSLMRIYACCCIIFFLAGCVGPRKINKWVNTQYEGTFNAPPKKSTANDYLSVTSNMTFEGDQASVTTQKTSNFLPLLFYWQFDHQRTCMLNPKIPLSNFTTAVSSYAAKKGLKQKLGNKRVELTLANAPAIFVVDDKAHLIWLVYAVSWDFVSVQPQIQDMIVTYKVFAGDNETKNGTITIPDINKPIPLKEFQSVKRITFTYLDNYDANIAAMARQVVDKLIAEL